MVCTQNKSYKTCRCANQLDSCSTNERNEVATITQATLCTEFGQTNMEMQAFLTKRRAKKLGGVVAINLFSRCTVIHQNTETDCGFIGTSDVQAGVAQWMQTGYVCVSTGVASNSVFNHILHNGNFCLIIFHHNELKKS